MIGVLEWADKVSFDSFDKRGRLDAKILKHFKDSGVPEDKIVYLKDKQSTTDAVRAAYFIIAGMVIKMKRTGYVLQIIPVLIFLPWKL